MTDHAPLSQDRGYVGGGNIAGILGLSPFRSPLDEYLTITGSEQEISPVKRKFFDRRKALEPFAAECFQIATGVKIVERNHRYDDAEFPWMKAEIDFETEDVCNGETKSVHTSAAWQWGDPDAGEEPPLYVSAQVMFGLGVRKKERTYVHALIGLDDDRIYVVERDDAMIAEIRARAASFWKHHIEPRRMPQPTTIEDLLRLYQRDSGRAVEADTEIHLALSELSTVKQKLKLLESQKLLQEYQIKAFMRDATTLTCGGIAVATWKARTDGVRAFRIK